MKCEVLAAVTKGRLDFGTWDQIFYGEFDGRRRKRVLVKIVGEDFHYSLISRVIFECFCPTSSAMMVLSPFIMVPLINPS